MNSGYFKGTMAKMAKQRRPGLNVRGFSGRKATINDPCFSICVQLDGVSSAGLVLATFHIGLHKKKINGLWSEL